MVYSSSCVITQPRERDIKCFLHILGFACVLVGTPVDINFFGDWMPGHFVVVVLPCNVAVSIVGHASPVLGPFGEAEPCHDSGPCGIETSIWSIHLNSVPPAIVGSSPTIMAGDPMRHPTTNPTRLSLKVNDARSFSIVAVPFVADPAHYAFGGLEVRSKANLRT